MVGLAVNGSRIDLGGVTDPNSINEELIWTELSEDPHSLWLNLIHLSRFGLVFGSKKKVDTLDQDLTTKEETQQSIIANC